MDQTRGTGDDHRKSERVSRRVIWRRVIGWAIIIGSILAGHRMGKVALYAFVLGDRIPPGVKIAGIHVTGWRMDDVARLFDRMDKSIEENPVVMVAPGHADRLWTVDGHAVGARVDRASMLHETGQHLAKWESQKLNPPQSILKRLILPEEVNIPVRIAYDRPLLDERLGDIGSQLFRPAINAKLRTETGIVDPDRPGRRLNVAATRRRIVDAWREIAQARQNRTVQAATDPIKPHTTARELQALDFSHTFAKFTTTFDTTEQNRTHNIRLAAQAIDGVLLRPGERFSFNEVVGPRNLETGYRKAVEIVNQELVAGVGGGICQVSSTLYNSVLLSNLSVAYRRNHSRPLGYVQVGRDATVYYGAIDFQFVNSKPFPVLLMAHVNENQISVEVRGTQPADERVEILVGPAEEIPAPVTEQPTPDLPEGESRILRDGRLGYRVTVFKTVRKADGSVAQEEVSKDYYPPVARITEVGTAKVATQEKPRQANEEQTEVNRVLEGSNNGSSNRANTGPLRLPFTADPRLQEILGPRPFTTPEGKPSALHAMIS